MRPHYSHYLGLIFVVFFAASATWAMPPGLSSTPANRIGVFPKPNPSQITGKQWLGTIPDHDLTPGVINTAITADTICAAGFTTAEYRHTTPEMIGQALIAYSKKYGADFQAVDDQAPTYQPKEGHHEMDHLISLEFGGADDVRNLWPQPFQNLIAGSHDKDLVEDSIKHDICSVLAAHGPTEANSFLHGLQKAMAGGYTVDLSTGVYAPPVVSWYTLYFEDVQPFADPTPGADGKLLRLTQPLTYYSTIKELEAAISGLPEPQTVNIAPVPKSGLSTQTPPDN